MKANFNGMKKILLLTVSALLLCFAAFSQGYIKNNSYFNIALNRPIMKYGNLEDLSCSNNLRQFYKEKYGDDLKHYAGALTVGANFYIHPIGWVIEGFKAGLCLDFIDLSADYYNFEDATRAAGGKKSEDTEKAIRKCKKDTGIPIENIRKWWMMTTDELAELKNKKEDERKLVYTRKMVV